MNVTLGQSVKQAVLFLERFYKDVYSLIQSMDGAMLDSGWESVEPNRISDDLGNGLTSTHWVMNSLCRIYVPAGEEHPKRAIAVHIVFSPEDSDEPVVLVAAMRFAADSTQTRKTIWGKWYYSDPVLRFLADSTEPRELNDELRNGCFPGSEHTQAFVIPLCGLTGAEVLHQRLLEPALTLVSA